MEIWKFILWLSVLLGSFWVLPILSDFYCKQKGYLFYHRSYRMLSLLYGSVLLTIILFAIAHLLDWQFKHIAFGAFPAITALLSFFSIIGFSEKSVVVQQFFKSQTILYSSIASAHFLVRQHKRNSMYISLNLLMKDGFDFSFFQYGYTNFYQANEILLKNKVTVTLESEVSRNIIEKLENLSAGEKEMLLKYLS